jgi:Ulp1 family protease
VNLKNYHRILFPVFILNKKSSHRHWALISVNLKNMKMICYDGMYYQSEDAKNAMKAIAQFMDFLREFNNNNFKHNSSKSLDSFLSTTKYSSDYQETCLDESFDSEASFDSFTSDDYEHDMTNCHKELNFNLEAEKSTEWKLTFANAPQTNNTDSGVFVCKFIEYLTRNEPILFSKDDTSYFRLLMSNELLENRILTV